MIRQLRPLALLLLCTTGAALANPPAIDSGTFRTAAKFSGATTSLTLSSAVATIELRPGALGYSSLKVTFHFFPVAPGDVAGLTSGNLTSVEKRWNEKAGKPKDYNASHAVIQLSVAASSKV